MGEVIEMRRPPWTGNVRPLTKEEIKDIEPVLAVSQNHYCELFGHRLDDDQACLSRGCECRQGAP